MPLTILKNKLDNKRPREKDVEKTWKKLLLNESYFYYLTLKMNLTLLPYIPSSSQNTLEHVSCKEFSLKKSSHISYILKIVFHDHKSFQ